MPGVQHRPRGGNQRHFSQRAPVLLEPPRPSRPFSRLRSPGGSARGGRPATRDQRSHRGEVPRGALVPFAGRPHCSGAAVAVRHGTAPLRDALGVPGATQPYRAARPPASPPLCRSLPTLTGRPKHRLTAHRCQDHRESVRRGEAQRGRPRDCSMAVPRQAPGLGSLAGPTSGQSYLSVLCARLACCAMGSRHVARAGTCPSGAHIRPHSQQPRRTHSATDLSAPESFAPRNVSAAGWQGRPRGHRSPRHSALPREGTGLLPSRQAGGRTCRPEGGHHWKYHRFGQDQCLGLQACVVPAVDDSAHGECGDLWVLGSLPRQVVHRHSLRSDWGVVGHISCPLPTGLQGGRP